MTNLIYGKIMLTIFGCWFMMHLLSHPSSPIAKWGEKKCGGYGGWLGALAVMFAIPEFIVGVCWLWHIF